MPYSRWLAFESDRPCGKFLSQHIPPLLARKLPVSSEGYLILQPLEECPSETGLDGCHSRRYRLEL